MKTNEIMRISNPPGLSFEFLENGSLKSIEVDPIRISLKATTPFSKSGANIFIRKRKSPMEFKALYGPYSNSRFAIENGRFISQGNWNGIEYSCTLQLSKKSLSWQWNIAVKNCSDNSEDIDLIYLQDIGLKSSADVLINEYYVSQYLERRILDDKKYGSVICCRQNMKESNGNPWLMMACRNSAVAASTDGMQFYGKTYRETGTPEGLLIEKLGGEYAGESSVLALQEMPFKLGAGEEHRTVFSATYLPDHPQATSEIDLDKLPDLFSEFESEPSTTTQIQFRNPSRNLFNTASFLPVDELNQSELERFFGKEKRHCEEENGRLLSFFSKQNNHVILHAKEILVDRPHAHIMQSKARYLPDENIVSTTTFAFGVFNSHITQGNTNFNTLLSVCTSQFNTSPELGQRIFVEVEGKNYLLGIPSAYELGLNHSRWIYKHGDDIFQVRTWTSGKVPQVNMDFIVISGKRVKLLITHDFDALNRWKIVPGNSVSEFVAKPNSESMVAKKFPGAQFRIIIHGNQENFKIYGDEILYSEKKSRGNSMFVIDVSETYEFCMSFIGEICSAVNPDQIADADQQFLSDYYDAQASWKDLSLNLSLAGANSDIAAIREILPWFGLNALIHYLTPYGLEQFSGAAWGTRDVSQGPVELLLNLQKYDEARQVLKIIFSNQNPDGGWPQWWMFDSYQNIRAHDSHGDVYYWCIIALSNYIKVTGDLIILDEVLPYYHEKGIGFAEKTALSEHIDRLIRIIINSFIPGTALVPFGGGDWNDSLQPVSKELANRMISSWTVEMNYQAFSDYQKVYELIGNSAKAEELRIICAEIKSDFNQYLVKDGVVAGYGLVEANGSIIVLLHPVDSTTNIHYSILPMNRGIISEIFTDEQAHHHQELIEEHLKGPDGARLMDRPLQYQGGVQTIFQRAESSTFFGREIGLMYVHEHIRYAEALARTGKADAFVKALRQAIPVEYKDVVPCGDFRQSNCYYSSSDVSFKSRYEADERYDEIQSGNISLKGGWRIYSSGPGIYIGLVISRLLGLRIEFGKLIIDPVMPHNFNGLVATMVFYGHSVNFKYVVKENNYSPKVISINDKNIQFIFENNKYRRGGAVFPLKQFLDMLDLEENVVVIEL